MLASSKSECFLCIFFSKLNLLAPFGVVFGGLVLFSLFFTVHSLDI